MERALELAAEARFTSPNPRVGAVLVADGRVIAEAFHEGAGRPHAERLVLKERPPAGATLYVTLEPCTHHGRTPPCASLVAESNPARVVVAMEDPDERVRGRGIALLRDAGIEVETGVLEQRARDLNRAYIHHRKTGLPFMTVKLALSLDGRLAAPDGSSRWITGPAARARVHNRRAEVDAVMVGAQTVLSDDPLLTARDVSAPRQPARVVVDAAGRVPATANVFSPGVDVLVATTRRSSAQRREEWAGAGGEVLVLEEESGGVDLVALLKALGSRDMLEIYCEGGGRLASSLLAHGLIDRLELNYGAVLLGRGGPDLGDLGIATIDDAPRWVVDEVVHSGDDVLVSLGRKERD
jgi:diaminohydroxyphosphoribosylaminopyrimidine deaminase / 5-amino-6-(5-phosphoribosylamino)uracil reductase